MTSSEKVRLTYYSRHGKMFLLACATRPALGPTRCVVQWVPGVLLRVVKGGRGVVLTEHLIPCLSQEGILAVPPLPSSAAMACIGTVVLASTQTCLCVDLFKKYLLNYVVWYECSLYIVE
jgi:hypothetical protein